MRNISIQLEDDLFRKFAVACAEIGFQKKTLITSLIKDFLENEEDKYWVRIAQARLKRLKTGKAKLIRHEDAWK